MPTRYSFTGTVKLSTREYRDLLDELARTRAKVAMAERQKWDYFDKVKRMEGFINSDPAMAEKWVAYTTHVNTNN